MDDHDATLMRRLRSDDQAALDRLLREHWVRLIQYARTIVGDWDAAEDLAQDAFVRLWAGRRDWTDGPAWPLLVRITRNAALDSLKSKRHATRVDLSEIRTTADRDVNSDADGLREAVKLGVDQMPPRRREVFLLVREQGLAYGEAAEVLGVSRQTVANQLSRAMKELRAFLRPWLSEAEPDGSASSRSSDQGGRPA